MSISWSLPAQDRTVYPGQQPQGSLGPVGATGTVDVDDQGRIRHMEVVFGDSGNRNVIDDKVGESAGEPTTKTS
jgi:hypothetical protein